MSKITKKRHKHKSNEELKKMGLFELSEHLKKLLKESEESSNRVLNPFAK